MKAAAALGYTVTLEELERAAADLEKLDDDELNDVDGGCNPVTTSKPIGKDEKGRDVVCLADWHCHIVTLHSETSSKDVACWKDYGCVFINKKGK